MRRMETNAAGSSILFAHLAKRMGTTIAIPQQREPPSRVARTAGYSLIPDP